jgi:hypothetical protein
MAFLKYHEGMAQLYEIAVARAEAGGTGNALIELVAMLEEIADSNKAVSIGGYRVTAQRLDMYEHQVPPAVIVDSWRTELTRTIQVGLEQAKRHAEIERMRRRTRGKVSVEQERMSRRLARLIES